MQYISSIAKGTSIGMPLYNISLSNIYGTIDAVFFAPYLVGTYLYVKSFGEGEVRILNSRMELGKTISKKILASGFILFLLQ